ncbi:MAG: tetratricopeptide repeat protein [Thermoplasmata archaeon]
MGERALTVRDRIVVHLSAFNRFAEEFECPEDMCQSGISAAIGKSRAHITLELNRMKDAGLVTERNAHVKGAKSKRKIYVLTPQGQAKYSEISGFLDAMRIEIVEPDGSKMLSGVEAAEYLRMNLSMQRVVAVDMILASGGMVKIAQLRKANGNIQDCIPHIPPRQANYLPRKEMTEIREILEREKPNTVLLLGIPGIGKTALLSELARKLDRETKVMYRRLYPFDSQTTVLASIADFLDGMGDGAMRKSMAHRDAFDLSEARSHLVTCFSKSRILLMLDEYEQAPAALRPLFAMLMEMIKDSGSGMIVASARRGNFYSLKNLALDCDVGEVVLGPLDEASSLKLLADIDGSEKLTGIGVIGGHPLTLKLLATGIQPASLAGFVEDEILGGDSEMSKLCKFTAVLRKPFMPDDLELFGFSNASGIRKDLAFEAQPGGGYLLHPAISSIMLASSGKRMLGEMHSRAAEFYMRGGAVAHESLHHLIQANQMDDARKFIRDNREKLLATDNIGELAGMMELALPGCDSVNLMEMASVVFDRAGNWDRAMRLAMDIANREPDSPAAMRSQTLRANILTKTGKPDEALAVLDAIPKIAGEPALHAKALYSRATALRRLGRNKDALKACEKAITTSKAAGDDSLIAQCMMESAMVMTAMGKHEQAMERLNAAMGDFERLGSVPDLIRCNINTGMVLRASGKDEEAILALEKSVELSEGAGLNRFRAHALANLTDLLNRKGEYDRSAELAEQARSIFSGLGEPLMQAAAMLNLCGALAGAGKKKRAMNVMDDAITLMEEKGLIKNRASWLIECADILRGMGESARAQAILKRYGI